jgi:CRP/FNR family transcriptional regulator, cyclic AMP receptor protein
MIMFTGVSRGGWFGEGSVIKRELRRYDIYAVRDTHLLHVPSATVRWLLDTSLEFNHSMMAQLNERLSQYISMVETDRMQDPVARVARSLALLFNPILYPRMSAAVPLSQQELGELAGLSRQSISGALKQLQSQGYITTEYNVVIVKKLVGAWLEHCCNHGAAADMALMAQPSQQEPAPACLFCAAEPNPA